MEFRLDLLERWYNLSAEERTEAMTQGVNDLRQHFDRCFPEGTVVHLWVLLPNIMIRKRNLDESSVRELIWTQRASMST